MNLAFYILRHKIFSINIHTYIIFTYKKLLLTKTNVISNQMRRWWRWRGDRGGRAYSVAAAGQRAGGGAVGGATPALARGLRLRAHINRQHEHLLYRLTCYGARRWNFAAWLVLEYQMDEFSGFDIKKYFYFMNFSISTIRLIKFRYNQNVRNSCYSI